MLKKPLRKWLEIPSNILKNSLKKSVQKKEKISEISNNNPEIQNLTEKMKNIDINSNLFF